MGHFEIISRNLWCVSCCEHATCMRQLYLTHYQMNCFLWRSLLACTWIKLTISPVLSGFQPPNSTQVLLQPSSTRSWLKSHPPINELAIVTAPSRQPLAQTGINASPSEMGAVQRKRTVFSTRLCIGYKNAFPDITASDILGQITSFLRLQVLLVSLNVLIAWMTNGGRYDWALKYVLCYSLCPLCNLPTCTLLRLVMHWWAQYAGAWLCLTSQWLSQLPR